MEKQIVVASNNKGKISEIKEIFSLYKVLSLNDIGLDVDVIEDGKTFSENSCKKASEISNMLSGKLVIADDSGIEIEYFDGKPGVYTKRWLPGTDEERNNKIIDLMSNVEKEKRKVSFICSIAISYNGITISKEGVLNGYISTSKRGSNGFGFDEIFELENGKTLAELSLDEKNVYSPRKMALELAREYIENLK